MALKDEIRELFDMVLNHTDEIEHLNFFIRMHNGTIFKYKMDKRKEMRLKEKEEKKRLKKEAKKNKNNET